MSDDEYTSDFVLCKARPLPTPSLSDIIQALVKNGASTVRELCAHLKKTGRMVCTTSMLNKILYKNVAGRGAAFVRTVTDGKAAPQWSVKE
jgi:hypothetical protein